MRRRLRRRGRYHRHAGLVADALDISQSGDVRVRTPEGFLETVHLGAGDFLLGAQEPDDEEAELVEGFLALFRVVEEVEDLGFGLLGDVLLGLEEVVELAIFDPLEEGGGDVHMHVQHGFAFPEFGEQDYGGFEMLGGGAGVVEVFDGVDTGLLGDFAGVIFVFGELGVDVFGDLGERNASVARPEEVIGIEIVGPFHLTFTWIIAVHQSLHRDSIESHLQHIVDQGLVGPRVRQHGDEIDITIYDDEYRPRRWCRTCRGSRCRSGEEVVF